MDLYLYGTLRHAPLFDLVAGAGGVARVDATLADHAVLRMADGVLPMLVAAPGRTAAGTLVSGLAAAQRARLDLYELAWGYDLRPVTVRTAKGDATALAYIPPARHAPSTEPWALSTWVADHAEAACLAVQELDRHDPPLTGAQMVARWGTIQARAQSQVRARRSHVPATLRRRADPGDAALTPTRPLQGDFFKFDTVLLSHRRFDGSRATDLPREVFVGMDAALVLPWDPVRDRVLLVEQVRIGPLRRGDPNPWLLEPVAGIVDADETPADAARREAAEEAGLDLTDLRPMFSVYATPGAATDHFHCFLGLADLPSLDTGHGGLVSEGEDIRLHVLTTDAALALIDTGEVNVAPLVAMLLWLARHRASLP